MPDLFLPSLEIHNFRGFEHLNIEKLGRVNLITGKNNVGKSALLEAVYLYANNGNPYLLRELLLARDELQPGSDSVHRLNLPRSRDIDPTSISYVFYGRPPINVDMAPLRIGPVGNTEQTTTISLQWFQLTEQIGEEERLPRRLTPVSADDLINYPEAQPYLYTRKGPLSVMRVRLDTALQGVNRYAPELQHVANNYIKVAGLNANQSVSLWDLIALTPLEDEIVKALRIMEPKISRVNVIGEREDVRGPIPIIVTDYCYRRFASTTAIA